MIAYCYVVSVGEKINSAKNIYHQGLLEEIKMEQRQHINALFQMIPKNENRFFEEIEDTTKSFRN